MMLKLFNIYVLLNITCLHVLINCAETPNLNKVKTKKEAPPADSIKVLPTDNNRVVPDEVFVVNVPDAQGKENSVHEKQVVLTEPPVHKDKKSNSTSSTTSLPQIPIRSSPKSDLLQSGALLRGFYVFLGLSVITIFYFVYRSYRLRHGSQPSTTVKKYGIIARRSDMEMRPLELDDDEDDTLFEVNTQTAVR